MSFIQGIGTDIVHIPRVARLFNIHGNKFLNKFLHPEEIKQFESIKQKERAEAFLASRWAVKEAAYKAFGNWRIPFPDMRIVNAAKSKPELVFEGKANEISLELGLSAAHVSISHDTSYATAFVILEKKPNSPTL